MRYRVFLLSLALLAAPLFASSAQAQRRAAPASHRSGPARAFVMHRSSTRIGGFRNGGYFGGPGYDPYYYAGYNSSPEIIEIPQSPIVFAQTTPPAPSSLAPNAHDSLVLELQGDHWVRLTNHGQSQTEAQSDQRDANGNDSSNPSTSATRESARRSQSQEPATTLPPAVLIFRDGHKEEIGKYAIIGGLIYANSDYWTSGSWTRYIPIAQLDIPATLKLNQETGANFRLPSGPNEIMARP
jgi:hypothetical protein